jgi:acyl-CoA synthetase (AMP-forming)/AMP-acid ligase II
LNINMARSTLSELFEDSRSPDPAIISLSPAATVSYRELAERIEQIARQISGCGVAPGDCVAMFLPNGIEFIELFLAVTHARAIAAPLNPALKENELRAALEQNGARAIIAQAGDAVVRQVAATVGIPVWPVTVDAAGVVAVSGTRPVAHRDHAPADPDDIALFSNTSGSTGRPKLVPLTHAILASSARIIAAHYGLTPNDRCLLVMPLFHGHGLIGAALSTLSSGGTLIVPPRFSASAFWGAFVDYRATWYTAVPTIHSVLLARADADGAPKSGPRFIRSCSAPLAPAVLKNIENRFGAPVIEAYGMTETAHQAASNPLPPRPHKTGSVGIGTGVELAIIDAAGKRLPANQSGEVIVRGAKVMKGYWNNPQANAEAFLDGWFRTGDVGVVDNDGYLSLTGRIKELINRGGEKISPTEVEAALLENSAVAEAAAFGVPDAKYGEEVWAAVVLKGAAEPDRLRDFCRERIADFKTPKVIKIVSGLPRNATGKIDRRQVAALFTPKN